MASGHVNRANRPNTWLLRPSPADVKKSLANPEPSTHGPKRRSHGHVRTSAVEIPADAPPYSMKLGRGDQKDRTGRARRTSRWTTVVRSTIRAIGPYEGYEWRSQLSADRLN
jgi:hypothetical protein